MALIAFIACFGTSEVERTDSADECWVVRDEVEGTKSRGEGWLVLEFVCLFPLKASTECQKISRSHGKVSVLTKHCDLWQPSHILQQINQKLDSVLKPFLNGIST